jgi:ribosome-binding protein aMBF1 (putative translation factor)
MPKTFGDQIAQARAKYGLSQLALAKIIGRSQFWISFAERRKFTISEPTANKILLAIHSAGQRVQSFALSAPELKDLRLGPRSNARHFRNPKTLVNT